MLAKELISEEIPILRTSDTGEQALSWMEIFKISHLPIVNNNDFLGLISEADIYDLNMAGEPIGNHNLSLQRSFVFMQSHILEVVEVVARQQLTLVPVLDEKNHYKGSISMHSLLHSFTSMISMNQPGGIIVLEMNSNDYSMSEIAQIVEGNDAKILCMYTSPMENPNRIEVNLKINQTDLSSIIQTFNRYNYEIKASYMENNDLESLYQNRYELLLRYLNT
ncbi:MAG: CBS domain-containing protein [Bacteroidales bacterium]|nr:CBS domain-containing protein [Bacteroidales bacterium]